MAFYTAIKLVGMVPSAGLLPCRRKRSSLNELSALTERSVSVMCTYAALAAQIKTDGEKRHAEELKSEISTLRARWLSLAEDLQAHMLEHGC